MSTLQSSASSSLSAAADNVDQLRRLRERVDGIDAGLRAAAEGGTHRATSLTAVLTRHCDAVAALVPDSGGGGQSGSLTDVLRQLGRVTATLSGLAAANRPSLQSSAMPSQAPGAAGVRHWCVTETDKHRECMRMCVCTYVCMSVCR